jgi:hypothetical protein
MSGDSKHNGKFKKKTESKKNDSVDGHAISVDEEPEMNVKETVIAPCWKKKLEEMQAKHVNFSNLDELSDDGYAIAISDEFDETSRPREFPAYMAQKCFKAAEKEHFMLLFRQLKDGETV